MNNIFLVIILVILLIFLIHNYNVFSKIQLKFVTIPKNTYVYHFTKENNIFKFDNRYSYFASDLYYIKNVKDCNYDLDIFFPKCPLYKINNLSYYNNDTNECTNLKILKFKTKKDLKLLNVSHENLIFLFKHKSKYIDGFISNKTHAYNNDKVFLIKSNSKNLYNPIRYKFQYSNKKLNNKCGLMVNIKDYFFYQIFESLYIYNNLNRIFLYNSFHSDKKYIKKKRDKTIRISSYNVHFWKDFFNNYNFINIVKIILLSESDIVCLQEAPINNNVYKILNKKYKYIYYSNDLCILSKYFIDKVNIHYLSRDNKYFYPRYYMHIQIRINKSKYNIFNTHLDVFDNTEKTRFYQIKKILSHIQKKNDEIIFLCGDLNSLDKTDYSRKYFKYLVSLGEKYIPKDILVTKEIKKFLYDTNHLDIDNFKKNKFTTWSLRKVDYIYTNLNKNIKFNILNNSSSDHYFIYCDLKI